MSIKTRCNPFFKYVYSNKEKTHTSMSFYVVQQNNSSFVLGLKL